MRAVARRIRALLTLATLIVSGPASAEEPAKTPGAQRVASINACTDQLLLALADARQIAGLSPYARDQVRSFAAAGAAEHRILSGQAEDVLMLKPDLVVAGRFTKRATRELLRAKGLTLVEFDAVRSIEEAKGQVRRMGDLLGQPARAAAEIARLDAAVERARRAATGRALRVLPVQRRGWVSGPDSLMTSLLTTVGLANAASDLGFTFGGQASLEAIVKVRPDLLLVTNTNPFAEDQGRAFLLHPALERLYPPEKRIVLPERLTVCGGPMLAEALDRLTAEIERVAGR